MGLRAFILFLVTSNITKMVGPNLPSLMSTIITTAVRKAPLLPVPLLMRGEYIIESTLSTAYFTLTRSKQHSPPTTAKFSYLKQSCLFATIYKAH